MKIGLEKMAPQRAATTVMMMCRGTDQAVRFAVDHPQYAIGVHLTLTNEWPRYRWKPMTDGKSLVDADGFMWHSSKDVERHAALHLRGGLADIARAARRVKSARIGVPTAAAEVVEVILLAEARDIAAADSSFLRHCLRLR